MFGWRKKNDGFVWHDYVRTTLLVRREQRRQKLEVIKDGAVAGVKQAGRKSAELGVKGATAAGRGIAQASVAVAYAVMDTVTVGWTASSLWLVDRWNALELSERLGPYVARLDETVRRPAVSNGLLLTAAVCAASAIARWRDHGFDTEGTITATLAVLSLVLITAPRLADVAAARGLAWPESWRIDAEQVLTYLVIGAAGIGLLAWLVPALTSGTDGIAATPPGKPVMVAASGRIEGKATVVSGSELRVGGTLVRLFGIDVPEPGQTCSGSGRARDTASCASMARSALARLAIGKQVICDVSAAKSGEAAGGASCTVNGADIAGQLVRGGAVFAQTGLFSTYASAEREAKAARSGLWKSEIDRPAEYRAKAWEDAKGSSPDGCPIKAVVTGDTKTYLVPWAAGYERAKVKTAKGERWFCTEAEARAAGWKPAEAERG